MSDKHPTPWRTDPWDVYTGDGTTIPVVADIRDATGALVAEDLDPDIARRIVEAMNALDDLPELGDGMRARPGMDIYWPGPAGPEQLYVTLCKMSVSSIPTPSYVPFSQCYSTPEGVEAAEAAKEKACKTSTDDSVSGNE